MPNATRRCGEFRPLLNIWLLCHPKLRAHLQNPVEHGGCCSPTQQQLSTAVASRVCLQGRTFQCCLGLLTLPTAAGSIEVERAFLGSSDNTAEVARRTGTYAAVLAQNKELSSAENQQLSLLLRVNALHFASSSDTRHRATFEPRVLSLSVPQV